MDHIHAPAQNAAWSTNKKRIRFTAGKFYCILTKVTSSHIFFGILLLTGEVLVRENKLSACFFADRFSFDYNENEKMVCPKW
jgi:hypothetical protein